MTQQEATQQLKSVGSTQYRVQYTVVRSRLNQRYIYNVYHRGLLAGSADTVKEALSFVDILANTAM